MANVSKFMDILGGIKTFLYGIFIFLDLDVDTVKILAIMMAIDTVLGVLKALKLGNKISFKKLLFGLITKASVLIIPMILALTAKALSFDFTWFVNAVLNILVIAEAFSSITNILSIRQGKNLENGDFITKLLHSVRNGLGKLLNSLLDQVNNNKED